MRAANERTEEVDKAHKEDRIIRIGVCAMVRVRRFIELRLNDSGEESRVEAHASYSTVS